MNQEESSVIILRIWWSFNTVRIHLHCVLEGQTIFFAPLFPVLLCLVVASSFSAFSSLVYSHLQGTLISTLHVHGLPLSVFPNPSVIMELDMYTCIPTRTHFWLPASVETFVPKYRNLPRLLSSPECLNTTDVTEYRNPKGVSSIDYSFGNWLSGRQKMGAS